MGWSVLVMAVALSADSFGVGLAYGMRRVRFPLFSIVAISLCSSAAVLLSISVGRLLTGVIDVGWAGRIGGAILIGIGLWRVLQGWLQPPGRAEHAASVVKVQIRSLGVVIHVLRDPESADLDASGRIDLKESLLLGTALALDALAAGLAVSMVGVGFALVPFVALGNMVLLPLGIWLGAKRLPESFGRRGAILPGVLLILLGVVKLYGVT